LSSLIWRVWKISSFFHWKLRSLHLGLRRLRIDYLRIFYVYLSVRIDCGLRLRLNRFFRCLRWWFGRPWLTVIRFNIFTFLSWPHFQQRHVLLIYWLILAQLAKRFNNHFLSWHAFLRIVNWVTSLDFNFLNVIGRINRLNILLIDFKILQSARTFLF
jgi:hypothetical protein